MKIPEFKTEEEQIQFWEKHSLADYTDELEEVELEWAPDEDTCPKCGSAMEKEVVDIDLGDGLCLRSLSRYRCPTCQAIKLSEEALERLKRMDLLLKRYGLWGMILQKELAERGAQK